MMVKGVGGLDDLLILLTLLEKPMNDIYEVLELVAGHTALRSTFVIDGVLPSASLSGKPGCRKVVLAKGIDLVGG